MPNAYADIIRNIDPTADVERVGDIADARYGTFSAMTLEQWVACVAIAKG